ncbi:UNVERIFIED_CONTAM: zinc finger, C3HC4 type (RING finger) domain-containing protein [Hammondia hammondi]|eukprot:XP_008886471.1 zinc finger, C3HC4 type (RING finger) domain-containing protein [Hammondia hammondi]
MEADTPPVPGASSQSPGDSSPRSTWGASGVFTASRLHGPFASSLPFNGSSHSSSLSSSPVPLPSASSSSLAAPLLGASQHSFCSPSVSNSLLPSLSSSPFSSVSSSSLLFSSLPPSFSSLSSSASPSLHASSFPPAFFSREPLSMSPSSSSLPPSSSPLGSASPAGWTAQSPHALRQSGETGGELQREPRHFACSERSSGVSRRLTREETSRMAPIFAEGKKENDEGEAGEEEVPEASHAGHECPICLEKFECGEMRRPKVLTCGHSLCFSCILRILSNGDSSAVTALHPRMASSASSSSCFFLGMFGEDAGRPQNLTGDEEFYACMRNAAHCSFFQCPMCRQESRIAADNLALLPSGDECLYDGGVCVSVFSEARQSTPEALLLLQRQFLTSADSRFSLARCHSTQPTPKARKQGERRKTQEAASTESASRSSAEATQRRPTEGNLRRAKRPLWTDAQQENRDSRTWDARDSRSI